ncbi:MAG: methyltransferase domain-containing protein [Thermodesulfobacteriota bacterium]
MHTRILWTLVMLSLCGGCTSVKRFGYEGFGRDDWQQPARVVETLRIEPGDRVADLGAGGGYFTFRLADAVGPDGVVYGVDVDPGMIAYLRDRAADEGYANVQVVEAASDDARLPAGAIDLLFTCNTYHHIPDQQAYFARAKQALAPGGRVAIVEYRDEGFFATLFGHATGEEAIERDMEAAGYRLEGRYDFLDRQSFLVFVPAA